MDNVRSQDNRIRRAGDTAYHISLKRTPVYGWEGRIRIHLKLGLERQKVRYSHSEVHLKVETF